MAKRSRRHPGAGAAPEADSYRSRAEDHPWSGRCDGQATLALPHGVDGIRITRVMREDDSKTCTVYYGLSYNELEGCR